MTSPTTVKPEARATESTSTIAEPHGIESDGSGRQSPRRKTVVAASLVAVIAVIAALVGMVFPEMLAAAVATAVVALIVVLDWVLGSREPQQAPLGYWTL
jgi:Flp pilus assembly protein TadB